MAPLHASLVAALAAEGDQAQALAVYRARSPTTWESSPNRSSRLPSTRVLTGSIAAEERSGALVGRAGELAAYLGAGDLIVVRRPGVLMIEPTANVEDESQTVVDEPEDERLQQGSLPPGLGGVPAGPH